MATKLEQDFETWWEREGQEFLFALNTTTDDDIKLVAEIAWKNGAYCAEQAEQEPVAWIKLNEDGVYIEDVTGFPVYAAPVQQVDLTDDEIMDLVRDECVDMRWPSTPLLIARAVIAADREKNK